MRDAKYYTAKRRPIHSCQTTLVYICYICYCAWMALAVESNYRNSAKMAIWIENVVSKNGVPVNTAAGSRNIMFHFLLHIIIDAVDSGDCVHYSDLRQMKERASRHCHSSMKTEQKRMRCLRSKCVCCLRLCDIAGTLGDKCVCVVVVVCSTSAVESSINVASNFRKTNIHYVFHLLL